MAVPVNVYVDDGASVPVPLPGTTVSIFNPTTMVQVALGVSDSNGMAAFLLPGGSYEARFFRQGYVFENPHSMVVQEPEVVGQPNGFSVSGLEVGVFGIPSDPAVCRCAGRFVDLKNQPMRNTMLRISAEAEVFSKSPKVAYGSMVSQSAMELRTDSNGFAVVDLLRTGQFWLTFSGEEDVSWNFTVPDRASANLVDLIHPQPLSLSYSAVGNSVALAVGATVVLDVVAMFSDYQDHAANMNGIVFLTNSDPAIAGASLAGAKLSLTGLAPGVVTLTAGVEPGLFPVRLPDYSISAPVLTVTVS